MYSADYDSALATLAKTLKTNPAWLYNVIMLESAWNPAAYNKSGAVGLIQFMPQTLKDYGLLSTQLAAKVPSGTVPEEVKQEVRTEFLSKYPDVLSQLQGPILKYFQRYKDYSTEQSVYLTVLYPTYRNATLDTAFSSKVQAQNPGIVTVGDYVALVQSKAKARDLTAKITSPISLLAVAAIGVVGYLALQRS